MGLKKTIVFIFFFPILFFGQQVNFLEIYKNLELFKAEKINSNKEARNIISRALQHNRYLATTLKKIIPKKIINWLNFLLYK